jgi:hypothetical protein
LSEKNKTPARGTYLPTLQLVHADPHPSIGEEAGKLQLCVTVLSID